MPDAWILPRDNQSILWRRADAGTYRDGGARIVEVGPVPMPPRALHVLDLEADTLVYAHQGELTVVRGLLRGERAAATVKLPQGSVIHALAVVDEVVFTGGDAGAGMLGWVDLRGELRWQGIEVPSQVRLPRKGVDGLVLHGERLIAVDDMVIPLYLLVLDVAGPRAPRVVEIRRLKPHSTAEQIFSVASSGDTMALLSMSGNHGVFSVHLALMDLPTLEEWATLTVQPESSPRRWADRAHDFSAVALHGDLLLIAAGADGIGLLRVPPRPPGLVASVEPEPSIHSLAATSRAPAIPVEQVRFIPVANGRVVDVIPVDEGQAFAVVESKVGLFKRVRIEAALVSLVS